MIKIAIFTSNELRHSYFRVKLANTKNIHTIFSLIEKDKNKKKNYSKKADYKEKLAIKSHLLNRKKKEQKYFDLAKIKDKSKPIKITPKKINDLSFHQKICKTKPDFIFTFGCSIIKKEIIDFYNNKIINFHLGLSPYYKGSGTNFWPLVNKEPEYVGATLMFMDSGIDTGKIIHQIRPPVSQDDGPHDIGCKVICEIVKLFPYLSKNLSFLKGVRVKASKKKLYYMRKDLNLSSILKLYQNFRNFMIKRYIRNKITRDKKVKIYQNKLLKY